DPGGVSAGARGLQTPGGRQRRSPGSSDPGGRQRRSPGSSDPGGVYRLQRSNTAPAVNPAPTEASMTRSPVFRRPSALASASASGIVAAVVLPYLSRLTTNLSGPRPSRAAVASMIRRLA